MNEPSNRRKVIPDAHPAFSPIPPTDSPCDETPPPLDERFEDYLDHVLAPLVGVASRAERLELRTEFGGHLEALAEAYRELGEPSDRAVTLSLARFGDPREHAKRLLKVYRTEPPLHTWKALWSTAKAGIVWFGAASAISWLPFLCLGEGSPTFQWSTFVMFPLPLLTGFLLGLTQRRNAALAAFMGIGAMSILNLWMAQALHTIVAEISVRGMDLESFYPTTLISLWLPLGCLSSGIGCLLRWVVKRTLEACSWVRVPSI